MAEKVEFIESYIKGANGSADYQWNDNHGELVRCKDCKHYDKDPYCKGFGDCTGACDNLVKVHDDWFCADGERKSD